MLRLLRVPLAMCRVALALLVAVAPAAAAALDATAPRDTPFSAAKRTAIEATLNRAWRESKAPGAVVGVWVPGEGSFVAAVGVSDPATRKPMRGDEHFRIGSITKTFTVTALLQLVDEKKLRLDDPVTSYLAFVPNGEHVTLRMLANMTSGLYNYTEDDAWVKEAFGDFQRTWTPRELVDVGLAHPPNFAAGTGFHYSNTNTVLLGMVIEKVTGKPIGDVFAEKIFKSLHLNQTRWPVGSAMPEPFAHGVTEQTLDGRRADATLRNPSWGFTAGQLISTMADLRTWVRSYATGSLISPVLQRERLTYVTFPPNSARRKYALGIGYDSGWLGHSGELPGYNCGAYYLPEKDATIVVMVNSDIAVSGANPMPIIFKALAREIFPDHAPQ